METHKFAELFPPMSEPELAALAADIEANGLRSAVVTLGGEVLDGRNRAAACEIAGVQCRTVEYKGKKPLEFVLSQNLHRRHLDAVGLAQVALKLANMPKFLHKDDASLDASGTVSQTDAAERVGVSVKSIERLKAVYDSGDDGLIAQVDGRKKTLSAAVTELKRRANATKLKAVAAKEIEAPTGLFDVVVVDPPWPLAKIERECRPNQTAELDYPTMEIEDIQLLDVPMADDCHVFLWTTCRFLPDALEILNHWGLKYVAPFVWHKPGGFQPVGLPQFNHEMCLYARNGSPGFLDTKAFPLCFDAPRGAHSEKPEAFYETLRRTTGGRRLDMFGRRAIEGFASWGKEAPVGVGD